MKLYKVFIGFTKYGIEALLYKTYKLKKKTIKKKWSKNEK